MCWELPDSYSSNQVSLELPISNAERLSLFVGGESWTAERWRVDRSVRVNPSNEDYEMFCVKEIFKCHESGWYEKIKEGQSLKLGDAKWHPNKYSISIKRQSLGMPKASPSSSTYIRSSPLKLYFYCFTYYVLFLERIFVLISVFFVCW